MSETREAPRGSEHSFARPRAEIVEKFRKLTRDAMPQSQQDALIERCSGSRSSTTARTSSACCEPKDGLTLIFSHYAVPSGSYFLKPDKGLERAPGGKR